MKPILKVLVTMLAIVALFTALTPAHHAPAQPIGPYTSAITDLTVGSAQAQCCPYQFCDPEFGPYPSSCVSTSEPEYCEILINHSTGQRFCGSEFCL